MSESGNGVKSDHQFPARTATGEAATLYHLYIHPRVAEQDLNTLLPMGRWLELGERG